MIDRELPGRPQFECTEVIISDETLEFYSRNVLSCIRGLFGFLSFTHDLVFCPERVYTNPERTEYIYNEIHTGDLWWAVQVCNTNFG
jgi:Plavaka transposase